MNTLSPPATLLVAALVMLNHPCTRNRSVASLLLKRAAEDPQLTPVERDACAALADELDDAPDVATMPVAAAVVPLRSPRAAHTHIPSVKARVAAGLAA
jgi:hypothetical protein